MKSPIKQSILYLWVVLFLFQPFWVKSTLAQTRGKWNYSPSRSELEQDLYQPQKLPLVKAKLAGKELNLMLARTAFEKAKGLMFYKDLPSDWGMLFIYDYPHVMSFWMKNTIIPLDLIFFSNDLRVTELIKNMAPGKGKRDANLPHYSSKEPAVYALELNAGSIEKFGIKVGDKLEIPFMLLYSDY